MPIVQSSPHVHGPDSVTRVMLDVIVALVPAFIAYVWLFGWGLVINLVIALATALGAEAAILAARGRPVRDTLLDGSAAVTAVLLALAMPPLALWWLPLIGALFAIVVAKHLYGGLGYNPFNPAMVGYVALLIAFPVDMTTWLAPAMLREAHLGLWGTLDYSLFGQLPPGVSMDAITTATPLDLIKTQLSLNHTVHEIRASSPIFTVFGGKGWEVVNGLVLLGGLWLIHRRVITWHVPVAMLGALFTVATVFHLSNPDAFPAPLFHLVSGGTLLGAFFIATDPTTGATSNKGRLVFGAGVGLLAYTIRTWGGYPDAVAFSVLLMNMAAPTIDYYTQTRVYGHGRGSEP